MTLGAEYTVYDWQEGELSKCRVCGGWSAIARSFTTVYCPKCDKTTVFYPLTWTIEQGDTTTPEQIASTRLTLSRVCSACIHLTGCNDCTAQKTHIRHPYKTGCKRFYPLEVIE